MMNYALKSKLIERKRNNLLLNKNVPLILPLGLNVV